MKQNIYDDETFFKGYSSLRKSGVTYNDFIEQPAIKAAIPDLKDKSILDLGCGMGDFCKYCIEKGASNVLGVDISSKMINQAKRQNAHEKIEYLCTPFEELDLPSGKYDLIISSLAIHYIEDYTRLIQKINRLLKINGQFIFSTEHPIATARKEKNNWMKDDLGNKVHWALDDYQEEGKREQHWYVDGVITYHRTISTLVNTLIKQGFVLEEMIEPQATSLGLEKMPQLHNEKRRPSFIIIKSRKFEASN